MLAHICLAHICAATHLDPATIAVAMPQGSLSLVVGVDAVPAEPNIDFLPQGIRLRRKP